MAKKDEGKQNLREDDEKKLRVEALILSMLFVRRLYKYT